MRRFASCLLAAVCFSVALPVAASAYPDKPVRFIVPFAPGGTNDILARTVAEKLSARFAQPFIVDNRPGANSVVGCEILARATPDGHTLLIVAAGFAVNPSIMRALPFDTVRDFARVGTVASGPYLMVVNPSVPAKSVSEFIAWAQSRSGQINYASTGIGSPPHLAAELLKIAGRIDMQHVPYKGGGAVLPDLLANRVAVAEQTVDVGGHDVVQIPQPIEVDVEDRHVGLKARGNLGRVGPYDATTQDRDLRRPHPGHCSSRTCTWWT